MNLFLKLSQKSELVLLFMMSVLIRFQSSSQEYPPFTFCDEDLLINEINRMNDSSTWITNFFLSGGLNLYPQLVLIKLLNFFDIDNFDSLTISRFLSLILLGSLASVIQYLFTLEITKNKSIARISGLLFALSPAVYAHSRYHYPDHWIYFASGVLFLFLAKNPRLDTSSQNISLGALIGVIASIKYTGFLLAVIPFFYLLKNLKNSSSEFHRVNFLNSTKQFMQSLIAMVLVFSILNFSIFYNFNEFLVQFAANAENYGFNQGSAFKGLVYYLLVILVLSFGVFGIVFTFFGLKDLLKINKSFFSLVLLVVITYVAYLGNAQLVLNRNITILYPLIFLIFAIGINGIFRAISYSRQRIIAICIIFILVLQPIFGFFHSYHQDFKVDSRVLATKWLQENLESDAFIGIEQSCYPPSPAQIAGFTHAIDKNFQFMLPYYVLTSYWSDSLINYYRSNSTYQILFNQKYIHYYNFSDKRIFFRIFSEPKVNDFFPSNYSVIKKIDSNGPVVYILQKTN